MRFVGRYLDELSDEERGALVVKRVEDRLKVATRELIIREKQGENGTEVVVSRVLDAPID